MINTHSAGKKMASTRKELSQYYTSASLGDVVCSMLNLERKHYDILDLSVGEGSLLISVEALTLTHTMYGVDIDEANIAKLQSIKPHYKLLCADATRIESLKQLSFFCDEFDLILGNPPFKKIILTEEIKKTLIDAYKINGAKTVRVEIVFLLFAIKMLKKDGLLAYILPDGVFTNKYFSDLRSYIYSDFEIVEIKEIPGGAFQGTEAKTHILVLKKCLPRKDYLVKLSCLNIDQVHYISKCQFLNRGDFSFYNMPQAINYKTFRDLGVQLIRGKNKNESKKEVHFLHTTSFLKNYNEFKGNSTKLINVKDCSILATTGDILIPRVGSRCLGKIGLILGGQFMISDCLIIIRINDNEIREKIISSLQTPFGINWIRATSKGVGAKHITLTDLFNFPVM